MQVTSRARPRPASTIRNRCQSAYPYLLVDSGVMDTTGPISAVEVCACLSLTRIELPYRSPVRTIFRGDLPCASLQRRCDGVIVACRRPWQCCASFASCSWTTRCVDSHAGSTRGLCLVWPLVCCAAYVRPVITEGTTQLHADGCRVEGYGQSHSSPACVRQSASGCTRRPSAGCRTVGAARHPLSLSQLPLHYRL